MAEVVSSTEARCSAPASAVGVVPVSVSTTWDSSSSFEGLWQETGLQYTYSAVVSVSRVLPSVVISGITTLTWSPAASVPTLLRDCRDMVCTVCISGVEVLRTLQVRWLVWRSSRRVSRGILLQVWGSHAVAKAVQRLTCVGSWSARCG